MSGLLDSASRLTGRHAHTHPVRTLSLALWCSLQVAASVYKHLAGLDIIANFNTAIQVDDDGSRPDALIRDRTGARLGAPEPPFTNLPQKISEVWPLPVR